MGSNFSAPDPLDLATRVDSANIKSDAGLAVNISTKDALVGRLISELVSCGVWAELEGGDTKLIGALCSCIRANVLTKDGEPIVWPSQRDLMRIAHVGEVTARRRIQAMARSGIISIFSRGVGEKRTVYILHFASRRPDRKSATADPTLFDVARASGLTEEQVRLMAGGSEQSKKPNPDPSEKTPLWRALEPHPGALSDPTEGSEKRPLTSDPSESAPPRGSKARHGGVFSDPTVARFGTADNAHTELSSAAAATAAALKQSEAAAQNPTDKSADPLIRFYPHISPIEEQNLRVKVAQLTEGRRLAVYLLAAKDVGPLDSMDIFEDPAVHIADDKLCDVINRISATRIAKGNKGGWWRTALRKHLQYGQDPVIAAVTRDRTRPPEKKVEGFEAIGKRIIDSMDHDQVIELRDKLVQRYRSLQKDTAADILARIENPQLSIQFWGVLGKNAEAMGLL